MPLSLGTLPIVLLYSAALVAISLLGLLMTATIVDEMTDTGSDKDRECKDRGLMGIATGLLGSMTGYAMVGQSMINVKPGGHSRLSTLVASVTLLLMVVFLSD